MHCLYYLVNVLRGALATILDEFNQVPSLKVSADPVLLLAVLEDAIPFEHPVLELTYVKVTVFEDLFSHSVQLRIHIVSSLHHSEFEVVLLPVGIGVVPSVAPSENKLEAQPIEESVLLKAHNHFIAMFLTFNILHLLEVVGYSLGVDPSDYYLNLFKLENSI